MERIKKTESNFDSFEIGKNLVLKGEQAAGALAFELSRHGFEVEIIRARKYIQLIISCSINLGSGLEDLRQHWHFMREEEIDKKGIEHCISLTIENAKRSGGAVL